MGKSNRSKRSDNRFAKGKITPVQVAFIVDQYLSDNNFLETRSTFRAEVPSQISKSLAQQPPTNLLSLAALLDEYISLKEQKVVLDQERASLDQEKSRVHTLLLGMQNVMNTYAASAPALMTIQAPATTPINPVGLPQSNPSSVSPSGHVMHNTPTVMPTLMPSNAMVQPQYFSPPVTNYPLTRKRAASKVVPEPLSVAKRTRAKYPTIPTRQSPNIATQSKNAITSQNIAQTSSKIVLSPHNRQPNGSLAQGSSVVKSLFNQPSQATRNNTSGPTTPPQPVSSQGDKSPLGNSFAANCSASNTPQEITPTNCTVISSQRLTVSPYKNMAFYTMERNHCISSSSPVKRHSKREHVKGRLDFDGSDEPVNLDTPVSNEISTSESEKEADLFDIDLPNLDAFGANFSFSELMTDFDIDCGGIGDPSQPPLGASTDNLSGSSYESAEANLEVEQLLSEYSSTVTQVVSGTDMNAPGSDNMTSVKSITKCIRILSPAKPRKSSSPVQEKCSPTN